MPYKLHFPHVNMLNKILLELFINGPCQLCSLIYVIIRKIFNFTYAKNLLLVHGACIDNAWFSINKWSIWPQKSNKAIRKNVIRKTGIWIGLDFIGKCNKNPIPSTYIFKSGRYFFRKIHKFNSEDSKLIWNIIFKMKREHYIFL